MSHASDQLWSLTHAISHQAQAAEPKKAAVPAALDTSTHGGVPRNPSVGGKSGKGSSPTGPEASRLNPCLNPCLNLLFHSPPQQLLLSQQAL